MTELEYQGLCAFIRDQYQQTLASLEATFRENLRAIESLRDQVFRAPPIVAAAQFHKQHGDLIEAVREAALRLSDGFTLKDVEQLLRSERPFLMLQSSRKSISTALRRLYEARELVLIEEGRGTKPASYSTSPVLKGTHQGKEAPMGTVSGRQA